MNAEIIAIGTELLLGFVLNRDTIYLSRVLADLGIGCYHHVTVGDNPERLSSAIETALSRSDLVITCGGLGPTVDDITLETIASVTQTPLRLNPKLLEQIQQRFARLKLRMPPSNRRQALIPQGAILLPNQSGTAPGFFLKGAHAKYLAALPGPPGELIPMTQKHLLPLLRSVAGQGVILSKTLKIAGKTESEVDSKVRDILALKGTVTVGIYAHPGEVELRITAKAKSKKEANRQIARVERTIRKRLGSLIFGTDEETLEEIVGKQLKKKRLTLAVAESCTGGLIGHRITEVPGSSDYFQGGVIAYANSLKNNFLDVSTQFLQKHGAVSPEVAQAMAVGVRRATHSDLGLAVTGIAGPTGGTVQKPVGLVYIALATPRQVKVFKHQFTGTRSMVKQKASQIALNHLRQFLS